MGGSVATSFIDHMKYLC